MASPIESTEEIKKQFAEDMQTYGNARKPDDDPTVKPSFDPSTLYYSRLLASMYKIIQDRDRRTDPVKGALCRSATAIQEPRGGQG